MRGSVARLLALGVLALVLASAAYANAASNTVIGKRLGEAQFPVNANALKPPECAALNLTVTVTGIGTIAGTDAAELMLGSTIIDSINGGQGADCLLGGAGDDVIDGGGGADVCIGGPGLDIFLNCPTTIQ